MAEQEFLVSFAVDIDEAGLEAIQQALSSNTAMAEGLAAAFSTAQSAIGGFFDQLSSSTLSTGETSPYQRLLALADDGIEISMELDMGDAEEMLDDFLARAEEPARLTADPSGVLQAGESALDELMALYEGTELPLNADASGVIAAGSEALSELESLYASTTLTVKVKEEKVGDAGSGSGGGSSVPKAGSGLFSWLKQSAAGGRYTERTETELAEDGNPEYVIPVTKKNEAVPLVRSLLAELPEDTRKAVEPLPAGEKPPENSPPEKGTRAAEPERTETREPARRTAENRPDSILPEINIPDRKQKPTPAVPAFAAAIRPVPAAQPAPEAGRTAAPLPLPAGTSRADRPAPASSGPEKTAPPVSGTDRETAFFPTASGTEQECPGFSSLLAALPEYLSAAPAAALPPVTQNMTTSNISAPVNIRVEAAGADPEEIGKSIYNTAEQYLLRTLQGVNA